MATFTKNQKLVCIYCGEKQEFKAIDYIPTVLNLHGTAPKGSYLHSVQRQQCDSCDEFFFLRLNEQNEIVAENLPEKLFE